MKQDEWWTCFTRNPHATTNLICFPHAGGDAAGFRSWKTAVPANVETFGIQLPGHLTRIAERPIRRMSLLVEEMGPHLRSLLERQFVLFGHSLGALLAFEFARWARRNVGIVPVHLFVSGRRAPQIPDLDPAVHCASDDLLLARIDELEGMPAEVRHDHALLTLLLPILRADFEVAETYVYVDEPPLNCPITVFAGKHDKESWFDRVPAWQVHTLKMFSSHIFDGGHFFIHTHQAEVLRRVALELVEVSRAVPTSKELNGRSEGEQHERTRQSSLWR